MKRKRNILKLMAASLTALLLTTSCNDSYPGITYEPDEQPKNDEDLKIEETPIKIYTRSPGFFSLSTRTRGTGPFEESNNEKYSNAVFHVFAFRAGTGNDGNGGQGALTMPVDCSLTAYSPNHETANDRNNQSCLVDGENYYMGMPYRFVADGIAVGDNVQHGSLEATVDYPIYYSGTYQDVGYNFFACYIDDWQPNASNTQRTKDGVVYNIDLDGNRDILLGHADQLKIADFERDGIYEDLTGTLTKEEIERMIGMAGGYSTYSGHRNVNPVIKLEHQLTRLVFQAYAGNASADRVTITGIDVKALSTAKMKVAGKKYDDCGIMEYAGDKKWFKLCDRLPEAEQPEDNGSDNGTVVDDNAATTKTPAALNPNGFNEGYIINYQPGVSPQPVTTLGTSLMLAPAKMYEVTLHYTFLTEGQNGTDGELKKFDAIYYINAPENDGISVDANGNRMFMPGVMYNIKVGVFGLEKIVMDAAVQGWNKGGDITIDPDSPEAQ